MIQQSLAHKAGKFPLKPAFFVKLLLPWGCSQKAGHRSRKYTFIVKTRMHIYSYKHIRALHTYQYLKGTRQYCLIINSTEVLSLSITRIKATGTAGAQHF